MTPCEEHLPSALASARPARLLASIASLGCAAPRVACAAPGSTAPTGFYPGTWAVTVSPSSAPPVVPPARLAASVAHELVHAFDSCRARVDRCEHLACTEVRAAALSGACDALGGGAREACVRRGAVSSVRRHGGCDARGGAEAGVAAVWAACVADRAPFEGAWRAPGAGGKPELVAPHQVDAAAGLRPSPPARQ